jgi:hypothetical protein
LEGSGPAPAPSPRRAPSPAAAPPVTPAPSPARYAYLVGRLRNRQITLEEATELFALQQAMVARAQADAVRIARGAAAPPPPARGPSPVPAAPATVGLSSEDALWLGALGLGAAAGLLAAILRRAREPTARERASGGTEPEPSRREGR